MSEDQFRKVYSSADSVYVSVVKLMLADNGIDAKIVSGLDSTTTLMFSPFAEGNGAVAGGSRVELWVLEKDFPQSHQLIHSELNDRWQRVLERMSESNESSPTELPPRDSNE